MTPIVHSSRQRIESFLTSLRRATLRNGDVERAQACAGQSARLARALPARALVKPLWEEAQSLLQDARSWR